MIWLTKIRTGEAFGVNPTEIVTVEAADMYTGPRDDAPNRVGDPRTPEGEGPWYANGSHVVIRNHPKDGDMVEQSPGDIRALLEQHEARFIEGMRAAREPLPYAPFPKDGPEVIGQEQYDRELKAWQEYEASLKK